MTEFKSKKVRSLPADVNTWVFVFQGFLYVPVLTLILRLRLCLPCLTSSEYSCTPFIADVDTDDTARIQLARSWTRPAWARHYMWSFQQTCITCIDLYDLYFVCGFIWFRFPGKSLLPWSFEIGRIEQWLGHARAKLQLGFRKSWQSCQEMTSAMKTVLAQLMIEDESLAELISIAISPDPKVGLLYLNHDQRARPHDQMWQMLKRWIVAVHTENNLTEKSTKYVGLFWPLQCAFDTGWVPIKKFLCQEQSQDVPHVWTAVHGGAALSGLANSPAGHADCFGAWKDWTAWKTDSDMTRKMWLFNFNLACVFVITAVSKDATFIKVSSLQTGTPDVIPCFSVGLPWLCLPILPMIYYFAVL